MSRRRPLHFGRKKGLQPRLGASIAAPRFSFPSRDGGLHVPCKAAWVHGSTGADAYGVYMYITAVPAGLLACWLTGTGSIGIGVSEDWAGMAWTAQSQLQQAVGA